MFQKYEIQIFKTIANSQQIQHWKRGEEKLIPKNEMSFKRAIQKFTLNNEQVTINIAKKNQEK